MKKPYEDEILNEEAGGSMEILHEVPSDIFAEEPKKEDEEE